MVKKAIRDCLGPRFSSARRGRLFSTNDVTWGFIDEPGSLRPSAGQQSGGRQSIIAFLTRIRQKTRATCAYARDLRLRARPAPTRATSEPPDAVREVAASLCRVQGNGTRV